MQIVQWLPIVSAPLPKNLERKLKLCFEWPGVRGCQGCMLCKTKLDKCAVQDDLTEVLEQSGNRCAGAGITCLLLGCLWSTQVLHDRTFSYLVPDFYTNPVRSRLTPGKKLLLILAQANPMNRCLQTFSLNSITSSNPMVSVKLISSVPVGSVHLGKLKTVPKWWRWLKKPLKSSVAAKISGGNTLPCDQMPIAKSIKMLPWGYPVPVYLIIDIEPKDRGLYANTFRRFPNHWKIRGRYLARGGKVTRWWVIGTLRGSFWSNLMTSSRYRNAFSHLNIWRSHRCGKDQQFQINRCWRLLKLESVRFPLREGYEPGTKPVVSKEDIFDKLEIRVGRVIESSWSLPLRRQAIKWL